MPSPALSLHHFLSALSHTGGVRLPVQLITFLSSETQTGSSWDQTSQGIASSSEKLKVWIDFWGINRAWGPLEAVGTDLERTPTEVNVDPLLAFIQLLYIDFDVPLQLFIWFAGAKKYKNILQNNAAAP